MLNLKELHMMTNNKLSIALILAVASVVTSQDAANNDDQCAELKAIGQSITSLQADVYELRQFVCSECSTGGSCSLIPFDPATHDAPSTTTSFDNSVSTDSDNDGLNNAGSTTQEAPMSTTFPDDGLNNGPCFEEEANWDMLMEHMDISDGTDHHFNKTWNEYKKGFSVPNGFWIGLTKMHDLVKKSQPAYMRLVLITYENKHECVLYKGFNVGDEESNFKLWLGTFIGSLPNTMNINNGSIFSTFDKDNDGYPCLNCAARHGGGWWFSSMSTCGNVWATGGIDTNLQKKQIGGIAYGRTNTSSSTYMKYQYVLMEIRAQSEV